MSIRALANAAAARRSDTEPENAVPHGLDEIAQAAFVSPVAARQPASSVTEAGQAIDTAINVLFGYIPTEILTLYVAVLAAIHEPNKVTAADWVAFWLCLGATPAVVWIVYAAKVKALEKPLPVAFNAWPVWEMSAGTLAFFAWAMALPNSPFAVYPWYSSALAGVAVLVASTVLGLLAPLFQRQIAVAQS